MTETEEMYLVTIAGLAERRGELLVPLSDLADGLGVLPASVNQMVHKLEERGAVAYLPYHGVRLLPEGQRIADQVLRRRRLWEVFLVQHLHLLPRYADQLAWRLEHITPPDVAERLSAYPGHPKTNSQGLPIPSPETDNAAQPAIPLTDLESDQEAEIDGVEAELETLSFLVSAGLRPGTRLLVLASVEQSSVLITVNGKKIALSSEVAGGILVKGVAPSPAAAAEVAPNAL